MSSDDKSKDEKQSNEAKEDLKKEVAIPVATDISETEMPSWQKQMWTDYTDDYSKQIADVCYNEKFDVLINEVKGKSQEELLFLEPKWTPATLIKKNMSILQTEHVDTLKSNWIQLTRQAAMPPEEYERRKISMPTNYSQLANERKLVETQYYEESARIMFKIKIGDGEAHEMSIDEYRRLERVNLKFAVDAVQLSLAKPEPKKAKISPSLYT